MNPLKPFPPRSCCLYLARQIIANNDALEVFEFRRNIQTSFRPITYKTVGERKMQRWKEEFVGHAHKKCVQINRNGVFDQGKILYMEPDWDCLDLLNAASQRMEMVPAAKRVFNADGSEIDDCMMIVDDDILFFSKHEDFIAPESMHSDGTDRGSERLPHSVGGYKVGELLGKGGFGEVRLGEHQLAQDKVALKFLPKSEIHSLGAAERTNTEIQCLATLKHMNIIKMVQHLESANHVVLIFELMEGGDLLKFLLRRGGHSPTGASARAAAAAAAGLSEDSYPQSKCTLSEDEARHTFYQVVSAISYAHNQHICHRDLKLENILLKDNSLSLVKIADFGLSDFYRPGATMKSSCGTLSFLAPEVFKGTANAGPPLDVWSLGVILFAMLCGRLPFEGPDLIGTKRPREQIIKSRITKCQYKIDDHLGPEVKDLVRRMLQVDPGERASIPEIFNHVWMRAAVGGCLPEPVMQSPSASISSKIFPSTPETVAVPSNTNTPLRAVTILESGDEDQVIPPLERGDSSNSYALSKNGRHRNSQSMNGLNGMAARSISSLSSTKSGVSSSIDLLSLEALGNGEVPPFPAASPPASARRHSNARMMLLSPSKDHLPPEKQISNSSIDFSDRTEPVTPRSGGSNCNPSPFSVLIEEGSSTPSQGTNKAFKLVPLRRQIATESRNSDASDFSSPSTKNRSYSAADATTVGVSSGARPVTGRRAGSLYGDYDDEDDSIGTSNWRNITLDPSPSSSNLNTGTASASATSTSSSAAGPATTSRKMTTTGSSAGSMKFRRETQLRSTSSSSLSTAGGAAGGASSSPVISSTKERASFTTAVNTGIAAISGLASESRR